MIMGIFDFTPLGSRADQYAKELSRDSIQTFLALRVVNAGLSLAQEVEFSGSIGVLSGSTQPLKTLEPLDDAVEYLSTAVFIAGSFAVVVASTLDVAGRLGLLALGFGLLLFGMSNSRYLSAKISAKAIAFSVQIMRAGASLYLLVISFALASVINQSIGDAAWSRHTEVLNQIADEMKAVGLQTHEDLSGLLGSVLVKLKPEPHTR